MDALGAGWSRRPAMTMYTLALANFRQGMIAALSMKSLSCSFRLPAVLPCWMHLVGWPRSLRAAALSTSPISSHAWFPTYSNHPFFFVEVLEDGIALCENKDAFSIFRDHGEDPLSIRRSCDHRRLPHNWNIAAYCSKKINISAWGSFQFFGGIMASGQGKNRKAASIGPPTLMIFAG